jgi:cyclic pyranopterin phosphate synthase
MNSDSKKNSIAGKGLSHIDPEGRAVMVDVGAKQVTRREAVAEGFVHIGEELVGILREQGGVKKGNVLDSARLAGIMGAKKTSELIPMCHSLGLDAVEVETELQNDRIRLVGRARCEGKTGVEMEAMTAVAVACLTVYDMMKAASKEIEIGSVRLLEKSGGKSGPWHRPERKGG